MRFVHAWITASQVLVWFLFLFPSSGALVGNLIGAAIRNIEVYCKKYRLTIFLDTLKPAETIRYGLLQHVL
jgi:hypothetical protein